MKKSWDSKWNGDGGVILGRVLRKGHLEKASLEWTP